MSSTRFEQFFKGFARERLVAAVRAALDEDGPDLTGAAVFAPREGLKARIVAKEANTMAGLPVARLALDMARPDGGWRFSPLAADGDRVAAGQTVAELEAPAVALLKAERVMLNFLCHLSGVATLTRRYADIVALHGVTLLDTRKTLPGLRHPEKYAVACGGGANHRLGLDDMLMLKDTHLDAAGSIASAVAACRRAHPNLKLVVECRTQPDVDEAVAAGVDRIMLDNMGPDAIREALSRIPSHVESEISGGVDLDNLAALAACRPDFISVGRITHSAPAADYSMRTG